MRFLTPRFLIIGCTVVLAACGSGSAAVGGSEDAGSNAAGAGAQAAAGRIPAGDWTRFDYDAARHGVGPADTGVTARNLGSLRRRRVHLNGTVDSSPIELHGIRAGGHVRDLIFLTTTYGRTFAVDPATGARVWEYTPNGVGHYEGSSQITNTTPIADPSRRYLFAASPDGMIHKLATASGGEVRSQGWPVRVTRDATHEKLASALNVSGSELIAATGGYVGDAPPYQGHVLTIDRASGRIRHVWNSLCSDRHRLLTPSSCPQSDSAIWSRAGVVVEPGTGRLLFATGNADASSRSPFDGRRYWANSTLELTPDAARLLQNWTPHDQKALNSADSDVGSTGPALLPTLAGRHLAVQGGKDGKLRLLDLDRLNGTSHAANLTGGELQTLPTPGGSQLLTAPAVWSQGGSAYVFAADNQGTAVYRVAPGSLRMTIVAENATPGTSPVLAGGLLYVYDASDGKLEVYAPTSLHHLASLPAAVGHWNSPIVIGGRVILPEGDANNHLTSGTLDIFHLPGR